MAVPARPTSGLPVATDWGQVAHDALVATDIQRGVATCAHSANMLSAAVTVTFPRPFAGLPAVTVSSDNYNYLAALNGAPATVTGFVVHTRRIAGDPVTGTVPIEWVAVGPRA